MDPAMQPIAGLSLERYAELSAAISDHVNDPDAQARIVEREGVSRTAWEQAKSGWTARMQDMSLMGRVAMAYMPLYQAALAKQNPGDAGLAQSISFDDYVAMSGCAKAMTVDGMLQVYGIEMTTWTQIAGHWNGAIGRDMMRYASYGTRVEQEGARIRGGGKPQPVAALANGKKPVGGASAQPQTSGGIAPGARVLVQWSDGNKYPGAVTQIGDAQLLVAFADGRSMWIPSPYVEAR